MADAGTTQIADTAQAKLQEKIAATNPELPKGAAGETTIIQTGEAMRGDVSASTVARMMGLATASDLKLLEGKVDLFGAKINNIMVKLEKAITILNGTPSGTDLERIDVQIGSLKTMLRDSINEIVSGVEAKAGEGKKPGSKIMASAPTAEPAAAAPATDESAN